MSDSLLLGVVEIKLIIISLRMKVEVKLFWKDKDYT